MKLGGGQSRCSDGRRDAHVTSNSLTHSAYALLRLPTAASENEARSLCNHRRAYKFFTDSVSPRCHFPAAACDSYESFLQGRCFPCDPASRPCGNMGYYADRALARGALYLVTRDEEPFCGECMHVRTGGVSRSIAERRD